MLEMSHSAELGYEVNLQLYPPLHCAPLYFFFWLQINNRNELSWGLAVDKKEYVLCSFYAACARHGAHPSP